MTEKNQLSVTALDSAVASAASFARSALLMYLDLFAGASLALAFLALILNIWLSFLRRFMFLDSAGHFQGR